MIAAISMVRNEADIIEAFVRHTLSFADHLFIFEHQSTDNTRKILNALIDEGLSLSLAKIPHNIGYEQAAIINMLMSLAFQQGYTLVIPLDADEFLLPDTGCPDLHSLLKKVPIDKYYYLKWIEYRTLNETSFFALPDRCLHKRTPEVLFKIIIGFDFFQNTHCTITQGNHHTVGENNNVFAGTLLDGVHIAHFPNRSKNQIQSKYTVGWLSNVCKFTQHTYYAYHWADNFYKIRENISVELPPLESFAPAVIPFKYVQRDLKYRALSTSSYMYNLLSMAENLAETVCELVFLQKKKLISVVIPFNGDLSAFMATFDNAIHVDYPYVEYIVISLPQTEPKILEQLYVYLNQQPENLSICLLLEDTGEALFSALGQSISGTYIQWLLPGATIPTNKFRTIGAALNNNQDPMFICHFESDKYTSISTIQAKNAFFGTGINFYSWLNSHNIPDSYALTLLLFRHEIMPSLHYLKDCFPAGNFQAKILFQSLLANYEILVTI